MGIEKLKDTCSVVIYYKLRGNNNDPFHPDYRIENPWLQIRQLFRRIETDAGGLASTLGVQRIYSPDKSVWRIFPREGRDSADVAKAVLGQIEQDVQLISVDVVMAFASADGQLSEFVIAH